MDLVSEEVVRKGIKEFIEVVGRCSDKIEEVEGEAEEMVEELWRNLASQIVGAVGDRDV